MNQLAIGSWQLAKLVRYARFVHRATRESNSQLYNLAVGKACVVRVGKKIDFREIDRESACDVHKGCLWIC